MKRFLICLGSIVTALATTSVGAVDLDLPKLDQALGRVFTELVYIDEVNPISESTVTY